MRRSDLMALMAASVTKSLPAIRSIVSPPFAASFRKMKTPAAANRSGRHDKSLVDLSQYLFHLASREAA